MAVWLTSAAASHAQPAEALTVEGGKVYAELCAGCHGVDGSGGNSPNIQQLPRHHIESALDGIEEMPEFTLSEQEIDALAAYLASPR